MDTKKIAIGIVVLAIIGFAALQFTGNKKQSQTSTQTTQTESQTVEGSDKDVDADVDMKKDTTEDTSATTKTTDTSSAHYKNGTYTAVGTYEAPPGEEKIGVTVTLKDGVITESSLDKLGKAPMSQKMQSAFESGYKELVIGKNINDID
jgi:uncharacterized protein with FMN-binding domain